MEAFFGIPAQLRHCLQLLKAKLLLVLADEADQDNKERNVADADERYDGPIEECNAHAANETTYCLEQLPLTLTKALINLCEVLSDITWHLLNVVFLEERLAVASSSRW